MLSFQCDPRQQEHLISSFYFAIVKPLLQPISGKQMAISGKTSLYSNSVRAEMIL